MKKTLFLLIVIACWIPAAFAAHPSNNTLSYENGISLRLMGESGFGVQGIVGLGFLVPNDSDANANDLDINFGLNVFRCMWESDHANFNLFTGCDVRLDGSPVKNGDYMTDVAIKFGAEPEVFLSQRLSVSTKMGLRLLIAGDRRGNDGKTVSDTGWMQVGTFGDMFGGAALNWYFW